ncbi:MAG: DUF924 family protein [Polyangiaceae bacterium]
MVQNEDVLTFWFGELSHHADMGTKAKAWFTKDDDFDAAIRERFGATLEQAATGALDGWKETPRGSLALVLVLDQFPRNLHRGTPAAFAQDPRARAVTEQAIDAGQDAALRVVERQFLYMPLMHSEDVADVRRCLALAEATLAPLAEAERAPFQGWITSGRRHLEIVERFGRYPHRNAVLGRASTPEEEVFLTEPNSSF